MKLSAMEDMKTLERGGQKLMRMLSKKVGREKGCTDARSSGTSTLSSSLLMRWTPMRSLTRSSIRSAWKSQGTSKARLVVALCLTS